MKDVHMNHIIRKYERHIEKILNNEYKVKLKLKKI